jgi:pimeloyl-ACP methyl ester carboxylesterase
LRTLGACGEWGIAKHAFIMKSICARALHTLMMATPLLMGAGCASTPTPGGTDSYTLAGHGAPVVVFQAGLGDDRQTWNDILPTLAAHYTVFAYDRPGVGKNPAVAGPRDPCTIAAELRGALQSAGLAPPYVLVGHSLGGLYQHAYASLYPQEVAGFVLIDPTHPRNWAQIQRELPATAAMLNGIKSVAFSNTERREFDDQKACLDRPEFTRAPGMRGQVLVAGHLRVSDPPEYEALHLALAREWPALAGVAGVEMVWDSAHDIHNERPDRVIAAVRQVASPADCANGCVSPQRRLAGVDIGSHPAFDIAFGSTRRDEVEAVLGSPRSTYALPDTPPGEVRVYHRKPDKLHAAVSFIPIVGDLVDAVEMARELQQWRALVVEYDVADVAKRAGLRQMK